LISVFGSGDILSSVNPKLSNTSQRIAKSRYIGLGTYNTETMTPGKILHISSVDNYLSNMDYWWFNRYYKNTDYTREDMIGLDINFHKHKNHGIELRIFDYFDESKLEEILTFLVLILDHSLNKNFKSPVRDKLWNNYVYSILVNRNALIDKELLLIFKNMFDFNANVKTSKELYDKITRKLLKKYKYTGECYKKMIRPSSNHCCIFI
jgi:hypothetical protein